MGVSYLVDPRTTPNSMRIFYNSALAMDDWFFTSGLALTGGVTYRVRFWYAASGSYDEALEVRWGSSATSGGMTGGQIFDNPLFSQTTYTEGYGNLYSINHRNILCRLARL